MAKVRFKWNRSAFAEVRTSAPVMAELDSIAEGIAARAGEGFTASAPAVTGGEVRGRASVYTQTFEAMLDQARNHTLEASL